jgi:hypothetical protein
MEQRRDAITLLKELQADVWEYRHDTKTEELGMTTGRGGSCRRGDCTAKSPSGCPGEALVKDRFEAKAVIWMALLS